MKKSRENEIMFGAFQTAGIEVTAAIGEAISHGLLMIRRERYEESVKRKHQRKGIAKMEQKINEIEINGVTYAPKDVVTQMAPKLDDMEYCMVRTYSAGVFAGYVESRNGKEAVLRNARRIWRWAGAASLSQLATDGTSKPDECKFPCAVDKVILTEVIEIIQITERAKASIGGVPVWTE